MKEKHTFTLLSALTEKLKEFQNGRRILLLAHEKPDGDAIGSLLGMYCMLKENNFEAEIFLPGEIPDMYKDFLSCPYRKELTPSDLKNFDLLLFLDCANQKRCSADFLKDKENILPVLNIDHHPDNSAFGDWNYFDSRKAATCEVLYFLAEEAGFTLSAKAAEFLLLGIITDSGCFRYDNTLPSTLLAASSLMEKGADRRKIIEKCYLAKPENLALLESDLLCNHLKKSADGIFAYAYMSPELLEKYKVDVRNTEQVIECIRQLDNVKACAVMRKEKDCFKLSLRSKEPGISVGRIARSLGGGGHEMAAGCSLFVTDPEEAVCLLLDAVEKEISSI